MSQPNDRKKSNKSSETSFKSQISSGGESFVSTKSFQTKKQVKKNEQANSKKHPQTKEPSQLKVPSTAKKFSWSKESPQLLNTPSSSINTSLSKEASHSTPQSHRKSSSHSQSKKPPVERKSIGAVSRDTVKSKSSYHSKHSESSEYSGSSGSTGSSESSSSESAKAGPSRRSTRLSRLTSIFTNASGGPRATLHSKLFSNIKFIKSDTWMHTKMSPCEEWASWWDNVFAMISTSVGFGDIFKFPQLAAKFGFFRYLFAYTVIVSVYGFPILFMEAGLGQFCSLGPGGCWEYAKLFSGVGYSMILFSVPVVLDVLYENIICMEAFFTYLSLTPDQLSNLTHTVSFDPVQSHHHYSFEHNESRDVMAFLLSWLPIVVILVPRIPTRGRIVSLLCVYCTVSIIVLTVMFSHLPGSMAGLKAILNSDKTYNIFDLNLWTTAIEQCFFSFNTLAGVYITLGSYNNFHNILISDIFLATLVDTCFFVIGTFFTSFFLGNLVHVIDREGVTMESKLNWLDENGITLEFHWFRKYIQLQNKETVIYFFITAFTIYICNTLGTLEVFVTGLIDIFGTGRKRRTKIALASSGLLILFSSVYLTRLAKPFRNMIRYYMAPESIIWVGMWMNFSIILVLGVNKFISLLECSVGWHTTPVLSNRYFKNWWKIVWCYIAPVCSVMILSYKIYDFFYIDERPKELWTMIVGIVYWAVVSVAFLGTMVYLLATTDEGEFLERFVYLITPTTQWGPILPSKKYIMRIGEYDDQVEEEDEKLKQTKKAVSTYEDLSFFDD